MIAINYILQLTHADTIKKLEGIDIKASLDSLSRMSGGEIISVVTDKTLNLGLKIIAAILIYLIGGWIINRIKKIVKKIFERRKIEPSLSTFLLSAISISLTVILIVITINALGIDTTSFIAILGGAGLAIGMAMSGTLQNLAGGAMILLFKPFKVGDYIEAQGFEGFVRSIEITSTHITTFNNEKIILPNGTLFNGVIKNSSQTGLLRGEWRINITYGDDIDVARSEILRIMNEEPTILKENTPQQPYVVLESLKDSSVQIVAKGWVKYDDYWGTRHRINERIYKELPQKGIRFPYPKLDVTINNEH